MSKAIDVFEFQKPVLDRGRVFIDGRNTREIRGPARRGRCSTAPSSFCNATLVSVLIDSGCPNIAMEDARNALWSPFVSVHGKSELAKDGPNAAVRSSQGPGDRRTRPS